jgi:hypothetical protein
MPMPQAGATLMGRPKKGAKKGGPPPDERVAIVNLKGSPEYSAWLDDLHRKTHIPKATIFRVAVAEWAVRNGHPEPPEI